MVISVPIQKPAPPSPAIPQTFYPLHTLPYDVLRLIILSYKSISVDMILALSRVNRRLNALLKDDLLFRDIVLHKNTRVKSISEIKDLIRPLDAKSLNRGACSWKELYQLLTGRFIKIEIPVDLYVENCRVTKKEVTNSMAVKVKKTLIGRSIKIIERFNSEIIAKRRDAITLQLTEYAEKWYRSTVEINDISLNHSRLHGDITLSVYRTVDEQLSYNPQQLFNQLYNDRQVFLTNEDGLGSVVVRLAR
jgi:hypothetical protein